MCRCEGVILASPPAGEFSNMAKNDRDLVVDLAKYTDQRVRVRFQVEKAKPFLFSAPTLWHAGWTRGGRNFERFPLFPNTHFISHTDLC